MPQPCCGHGLHPHGMGKRLHSLCKLVLFTSLTTHNATCGFSPQDPGKVGTQPIPSFSFVPLSAEAAIMKKKCISTIKKLLPSGLCVGVCTCFLYCKFTLCTDHSRITKTEKKKENLKFSNG